MEKLLALDVGLARIGVATCDPLGITVRPITTIQRRTRRDDFARLAQIVQEEEIQSVLCGLPLNMDGSEGPQAKTVRKWAMRLAHALRVLCPHPLPIILWDERLTTFAAQELMAEKNLSEYDDDALAAVIILQNYLACKKRGDPQDFGRIDLPPRGE
ncbi:MAG: Holliday junction resolvase RuvX [Chloroflexota bacterium]